MARLAEVTGFSFRSGDYDPLKWLVMVRGLELEPEKGRRCEECIRDRLRRTAAEAKEGGFNAFAAVLTVSPHKDAAMVNRLGTEAGEEYGIEYIPTNLKKQDGFKRSVQLTREMGIYRQDYCGCEYSQRQKAEGRREEGGGRRKNRVKPSFGIKDHVNYHQHPNINASKAPLFPKGFQFGPEHSVGGVPLLIFPLVYPAVSDTKNWIVKHSFDLRHHAGMLAHPCLGRYR